MLRQGYGSHAPGYSHDPVRLKAFARFAWERQGEYDVLVLSGDLATRGRDEDLEAALQFVEAKDTGSSPWQRLNRAPTLGRVNKPFVILPGNHDRYGPSHPLFLIASPGDRTFDRVFASYWKAGQGGGPWMTTDTGVQVFDSLPEKDGVKLALVGCDFSLCPGDLGQWGVPLAWFGQGRVTWDRLYLMNARTFGLRNPLAGAPAVVLWVIHFDPTYAPVILKLIRHELLQNEANYLRIPAILCGHSHEPSAAVPYGACTTVCICGSTSQCFEPKGWHLNMLDIEVTEGNAPKITLRPFQFIDFANFGAFYNVEETQTAILTTLEGHLGSPPPAPVRQKVEQTVDLPTLVRWLRSAEVSPKELDRAMSP
jgi:predicted phosphodiesterase